MAALSHAGGSLEGYVCHACRFKLGWRRQSFRNRPVSTGRASQATRLSSSQRVDHSPISQVLNASILRTKWPRVRFTSISKQYSTLTVDPRDINPPPPSTNISDPQIRNLYTKLNNLEHEAGVYINTSQLRLALRGLESTSSSEGPVTRLAILAIANTASDATRGARRMARALITDSLADEGDWEKALINGKLEGSKALLLRYASRFSVDDAHPLVRTMQVPSLFLQKQQLEIFIQADPRSFFGAEEGLSAVLVPRLEATNSLNLQSPRMTAVTFPVHQTLVYTEDSNDVAALAKVNTGEMITFARAVIDEKWTGLDKVTNEGKSLIEPVNVGLAEEGIDAFRKSIENGVEYERAWLNSGLPTLSEWIRTATSSPDTSTAQKPLKRALQQLIQVLLDDATNALVKDNTAMALQAKSATVPMQVRTTLTADVNAWSERAHTELRDKLDAAFKHSHSDGSKLWRKITWYQLFFRVDDVSSVLSAILERSWLANAEKSAIWLDGRIYQAGLLPPTTAKRAFDAISTARSNIYTTTVPALQSLAQSLLFHTLSTAALSTSLSALIYLASWPATTVFEASAIAALGTTWALRRLQTRWSSARRDWSLLVQEEARRALRATEVRFHRAMEQGGNVTAELADPEGTRAREVAREAISRAREALSR